MVSKTTPLFSLFYVHDTAPTSSPARLIRPLLAPATVDALTYPLTPRHVRVLPRYT
jgi:hypothetical protein